MSDGKQETSPYQEQKESFGGRTFDTILVFGHAPIKPLLLEEELTPSQREEWKSFTTNPLQGNQDGFEPEFRVLEGMHAQELRVLQGKPQLLLARRIELQHIGRLVLNRVSRVNALSAGLALYLGVTDKLILSGAGTIPRKASGDPVNLPKEVFDQTPSEAEMMKDVIVRRFGDDMSRKIIIEGNSVNTLENFVQILKLEPQLTKAAIIAPAFHLERLLTLARLHSIAIEPFGSIKDADLLKDRAAIRNKQAYTAILDHMNDPKLNPEQAFRITSDNKWHEALIQPQRVGYWLGYITELDIDRMQNIVDLLKSTDFYEPAKDAFLAAGLDFSEYTEQKLRDLSDAQMIKLRTKLKEAYHGKGKPLREKAVEGL